MDGVFKLFGCEVADGPALESPPEKTPEADNLQLRAWREALKMGDDAVHANTGRRGKVIFRHGESVIFAYDDAVGGQKWELGPTQLHPLPGTLPTSELQSIAASSTPERPPRGMTRPPTADGRGQTHAVEATPALPYRRANGSATATADAVLALSPRRAVPRHDPLGRRQQSTARAAPGGSVSPRRPASESEQLHRIFIGGHAAFGGIPLAVHIQGISKALDGLCV